jgi:GTPase SAR1 family protein
MGCISSKDQELKHDQHIKRVIDARKKEEERTYKVLLLGPGESGKSTVFRQMMINYGSGFSEEERGSFVPLIRSGIIKSLAILSTAGPELIKDPAVKFDPESLPHIKWILEVKDSLLQISPELVASIKALWRDPAMQALVDKYLARFHIPESISYFVGRIDEIARKEYIPSNEDLIRLRVRTTGIVQSTFSMDGHSFKIIDMGGQRSERKKWVQQFDSVTGILFVAAASEYDQVVWEAEGENRMIEALTVFREVVQNPVFKKTTIVLFLNKADLFEIKAQRVSLSSCFPDWEAKNDGDVEAAWKFLQKKFLEIAVVSNSHSSLS